MLVGGGPSRVDNNGPGGSLSVVHGDRCRRLIGPLVASWLPDSTPRRAGDPDRSLGWSHLDRRLVRTPTRWLTRGRRVARGQRPHGCGQRHRGRVRSVLGVLVGSVRERNPLPLRRSFLTPVGRVLPLLSWQPGAVLFLLLDRHSNCSLSGLRRSFHRFGC